MSRAATETRDHPAGSPASSIISVRDLVDDQDAADR